MRSAIADALLIDDSYKGYPNGAAPTPLGGIGGRGWNILRQDVPLPVAVLRQSAIEHNSRWMRRFITLSGAAICPHGKTTMSPQLFHRQLEDGAWGITVATVDQLRICRAHGIGRVLMANQLVGRQAIRYVLDELHGDAAFDFYCLVDSLAGVELLAEAAAAHPVERPLQVLLEGGLRGGRAGCRKKAQAAAVAEAVHAASPHLILRGIEGYEGLISGATPVERQATIEGFLDYLVELLVEGAERGWFAPGPVLLTAGGSGYFDLVLERFARAGLDREIKVVIRSGCYLTHDSKRYSELFEQIVARSARAREMGEGLRPALEVWALIQSMPEPGLAIATLGKRDVSFDVDLPLPQCWHHPGRQSAPRPLGEGHAVTRLNDQHAYLSVPKGSPLRVGDLVGFGVSHPCTTFDRWRLLYLVDDEYNVTGAIHTFF
ncbi:MAG: amino acid deaminase [Kiloniellales bacterium]